MNDLKTDNPALADHILVVDNDSAEADTIKNLLKAVSNDVVVCQTGTEALDIIHSRPIDLVLYEVTASSQDGFAHAKLIKEKIGTDSFVPIILFSSVAGCEDKIAGLTFADDYIKKPLNEDELLARINVMLRIRRLQQDVTQTIKFEKQQKIARAQLYRSARLASIGTFASGVAHELNNPLTAILGFSGSLLERMKHEEVIDKDELEQYLSIINGETVRCSEIVENLSQFAREGEVQILDFGLADCLDGAVKLVKSLAAKKNVTIVKSVSSDIHVRADSRKLQQAIVYVVTNALDFCKSGCTVLIEAFSADPFVKLCISDDGPGIAPDMLPKVFDPFFTTKEVGQGMGMGLAMCHVIMEECNGGIDVVSEKSKGTTVILEIPAA
jgi:two-component system, NtrC family, sensor kinase